MGTPKHYNKIPFRELKDEALEATGTGGFLTKPCPLMPSGHWEKVVVKIERGGSEDTYTTATRLVDKAADEYCTVYFGSTELTSTPQQLLDSVSSSIMIRLRVNDGVKFGECRCAYEFASGGYTGDVEIQGSKGWLASGGAQQYCCAMPYARTRLATDSVVYITTWAYVIPNEYLTTTE